MITTIRSRQVAAKGWACSIMLAAAVSLPAQAGNTDLASSPLVTSSSSSVYPNVFVMMDDSGSMNWDFLPDNQDYAYYPITSYGYASSQCNGVFYNPNINYTLPFNADGTQYPNQPFTAAANDGYGIYSGTTDLSTGFTLGIYQDNSSDSGFSRGTAPAAGPAYYYLYSGTQTSAYQKSFINTSSKFSTECNTPVSGVTSTFKISTQRGSNATGIASITVNGTAIASSVAASKYPQALGASVVAAVNAYGNGYSATCNVSGVACKSSSTSTSTATVIITGPASVAGGTITPVITLDNGTDLRISYGPTAFGGSNVFTKVVVSSTSGPGGTNEMQNFANWWSYYRTRINTMKSGLGVAFSSLGATYQVGFATMNNNGGYDMVNTAPFNATQKAAWYSTVYQTQPGGGTGLVDALARVGKYYANKLSWINNVRTTDPVGYSCQQNFAIVSTDGYWNVASSTASLTGGAVGNQDGGSTSISYVSSLAGAPTSIAAARPYCDGNSGCSGNSNSGSGSSNTLADVAMYYYMNDIRNSTLHNCTSGSTGNNVCTDNVPTTTADPASWHHMTLFTIGLGAPGYMLFDPNYANETATSTIHDYYDVKNGTPSGGACSGSACHCPWNTGGTAAGYYDQTSYTSGQACNWPIADANGYPSNIDDLWHAAVNGHGSYYSATDAAALAAGLNTALAAVKQLLSNSAAATTSSPNVTSSSDFVFTSTYTSALWVGELSEYTIDLTTGALSAAPAWTAAAQLDSVPYATRKIFFNSGGTLKAFTWDNLTSAQQAYFQTPHISTLSQFCSVGTSCLTAAQQAAASGQPMFNFVIGDRSNESADTSAYFRVRTHVLGDIVDSQAAYVGASLFQYTDAGYSDFITTNSTRAGAVYVGANDGMLHAFNAGNSATNAGTGAELWAFVPTSVMQNMYILGDKNYANLHQYFVDGAPVTGDVSFGGVWHTILVGGLNDGGMEYYALDVTDPANPSLLWEFTNPNLGYSYGNPVITKLSNGTWVVLLSSGYNNNSGGGDGKGHLFVLNAQTGAILNPNSTATSVGSTTSPSGLAKISAFAASRLTDNTSLRAYGGDLLGNLWRFDINNGTSPQLLVTLKDASGNTQPITTQPELGVDSSSSADVIYIGTGQYLGVSDLSNTSQQSFYAIKDPLSTTTSGAVYTTSPQASGSNFIQQTLTTTTCPASASASVCSPGQVVETSSNNTVSFATNNGWYVNFPTSGERDNTDATLVLGTVVVSSNTPSSSACTTGGSSVSYNFSALNGGPISTATNVAGVSLGSNTTSGATVFQLPNGTVGAINCFSNGTCSTSTVQLPPAGGTARRVGWHEVN
ncbi:MAG TPA: PilC/PilY family type IV pilus protein [Burkholderiaceae bacterium]